MKKTIAILMTVLLTVACSTPQSRRNDMVAQGYTPAYADGYTEGCSSGRAAAGASGDRFSKNPDRFDRDRQYQQGWNDGFQVCKAKLENAYRAWGV